METSVPLKMDLAPSFLIVAHPQQAGWEPCSLHLETNSQDLSTELTGLADTEFQLQDSWITALRNKSLSISLSISSLSSFPSWCIFFL